MDDDDVEGVDGRCAREIRRAVAVHVGRVRDVDDFLVRREADAVRPTEVVGHDADVARRRVVAVHLLGQLGFGPETLLVAVNGVGEPDAAVGMDDDVVGRIELAAVVIVQ